MGGQLIHKFDLYTSKYGKYIDQRTYSPHHIFFMVPVGSIKIILPWVIILFTHN